MNIRDIRVILTCVMVMGGIHLFPLVIPDNFGVDFYESMAYTTTFKQDVAESNQHWQMAKRLYDQHIVNDFSCTHTPRIPKIIHHIWLGSSFPERYRKLQKTWLHNNPDWQYKLWTDSDIEAFGLHNKHLYDAAVNWGQKSDIARYEILYRHGGLYIDTDFECLTSFDVFHHSCDFYAGIMSNPPYFTVNNALIGSAPHHPLLKACIETMSQDISANDNWLDILNKTGPYHLSECCRTFLSDLPGRNVLFPMPYFYPWPPYARESNTQEEIQQWVQPESCGIHHWYVSWHDGSLKRFILNLTEYDDLLLHFIQNGIKRKYRERKKSVLITMLYNETDEERLQEFIACMELNCMHESIDHVHVLYDTLNDGEHTPIHNYLKTKNVTITYITGRATYGDCFKLANNLYPNSTIILTNADIYFNETLHLLNGYDLSNKFLAITRWNVQEDGSLKQHICPNNDGEFSQDVWIFKTPLAPFKFDKIELGTKQCDGKIAYQAYHSGFELLNPCLSLQCCHLHLSDIRHYPPRPPKSKEVMRVPWVELHEKGLLCSDL